MNLVNPIPEPILSPSAQWALVIGFFMPLLVSVIVQTPWSKEAKTAIGFFACVAAAAIQLGVEQKLDTKNFFPTVLLILTVSISTFRNFWKPLGIADAVEKATSSTTSPDSNNEE